MPNDGMKLWILEGDKLVCYGVPSDDHNCDAMGCASCGPHVLEIRDVNDGAKDTIIASLRAQLAEAEKIRADQVIAFDAYAEQRDRARAELAKMNEAHDQDRTTIERLKAELAAEREQHEEIHDQTVEACYRALEKAGIAEQPDGGGQPDYILPSIVEASINLLIDQWKERAEKAEAARLAMADSETSVAGRMMEERDAARAEAEAAKQEAAGLRDLLIENDRAIRTYPWGLDGDACERTRDELIARNKAAISAAGEDRGACIADLKETASAALIALKREWPQHALWRAQSPEAEPIRRLAAAVGVELAP